MIRLRDQSAQYLVVPPGRLEVKMETMHPGERYERLMRLVGLARSLEAEGFLNAAKLYWGLVFSQELRDSRASIPSELDNKMAAAIDILQAEKAAPELIEALQLGRQAVAQHRSIRHSEISSVQVCRGCGEIFIGDSPSRCPGCGARPLTFLEFLPMYLWESLSPSQALVALASAPNEVKAAVQDLSEEQLIQKPAPDQPSVRNLILHVCFDQELLAARTDKMLSQNYPVLEGVTVWVADDQVEFSTMQLVEKYQLSRETVIKRLMTISHEDWLRSGWHSEFGRVTILQQASYFARHERGHLPQIEKIRREIGA